MTPKALFRRYFACLDECNIVSPFLPDNPVLGLTSPAMISTPTHAITIQSWIIMVRFDDEQARAQNKRDRRRCLTPMIRISVGTSDKIAIRTALRRARVTNHSCARSPLPVLPLGRNILRVCHRYMPRVSSLVMSPFSPRLHCSSGMCYFPIERAWKLERRSLIPFLYAALFDLLRQA
ncbi:hypothetical protein BC827DRAFT_1252434 [Russula dissimulans]|nr:hypothetical protein BC827DRAFT_1252434 [Russula dissimulans]